MGHTLKDGDISIVGMAIYLGGDCVIQTKEDLQSGANEARFSSKRRLHSRKKGKKQMGTVSKKNRK